LETKTDYIGNKVYENRLLKRILTEEGYIDKEGNTHTFHYYLKDHLGNVRVVLNENGNVQQITNYYPSGTVIAEKPRRTDQGVQPYKFSGKELDRSFGLDIHDFMWRGLENPLMRFRTTDPLMEKYYAVSPYAYCLNNPLRYTDLDGLDPGDKDEPIELPEIVIKPDRIIEKGEQVLPEQSWWWNVWYMFAGPRLYTPSWSALGQYGTQPVYKVGTDGRVQGEQNPYWVENIFTPPVSTSPASVVKDISKLIKSIKDLKSLKGLIKNLSKPDSKLTQQDLNDLREVVKQYGGQVRVDLTGVKGTGTTPHAHVEGLGSSVEARHIWLENGVK
jgi:RHS repeat-associated protein